MGTVWHWSVPQLMDFWDIEDLCTNGETGRVWEQAPQWPGADFAWSEQEKARVVSCPPQHKYWPAINDIAAFSALMLLASSFLPGASGCYNTRMARGGRKHSITCTCCVHCHVVHIVMYAFQALGALSLCLKKPALYLCYRILPSCCGMDVAKAWIQASYSPHATMAM